MKEKKQGINGLILKLVISDVPRTSVMYNIKHKNWNAQVVRVNNTQTTETIDLVYFTTRWPDTSDTSGARLRREQHECDTSATPVPHERHEFDTSATQIFIFIITYSLSKKK